MNYMFQSCEGKANLIISIMNFLNVCLAINFAYINADKINAPHYFIIIGGIGFLYGPGYSRVIGYDPANLTQGNPVLRNQIFFFEGFSRQVLGLVSMLVLGYALEKSNFLFM